MTNGLTDVKTTLFLKTRNCQAALQKLLEEQSDIRQHLRATNRYACMLVILEAEILLHVANACCFRIFSLHSSCQMG